MKKTLRDISATINVTEFMEYQEYLMALYQEGKKQISPYSYLRFAEDLGFAPSNVIRLVIARKRKLSEKSARTIAGQLGLKHSMRQYFLDLVRFNNLPGKEQKSELFLKVLEKKHAASDNENDRALITYFSDWTYPVVRELATLSGFQTDSDWLVNRLYPQMSKDDLMRSLDFLVRQGLLNFDQSTGAYAVSDGSAQILSQDAVSRSLSVLSFHQQMLDLAKQLLLVVPKELREYNSLTLRLRPAQWKELVGDIRKLCASALAREEAPEDDDMVVQLNMQLFPFTKVQG